MLVRTAPFHYYRPPILDVPGLAARERVGLGCAVENEADIDRMPEDPLLASILRRCHNRFGSLTAFDHYLVLQLYWTVQIRNREFLGRLAPIRQSGTYTTDIRLCLRLTVLTNSS